MIDAETNGGKMRVNRVVQLVPRTAAMNEMDEESIGALEWGGGWPGVGVRRAAALVQRR